MRWTEPIQCQAPNFGTVTRAAIWCGIFTIRKWVKKPSRPRRCWATPWMAFPCTGRWRMRMWGSWMLVTAWSIATAIMSITSEPFIKSTLTWTIAMAIVPKRIGIISWAVIRGPSPNRPSLILPAIYWTMIACWIPIQCLIVMTTMTMATAMMNQLGRASTLLSCNRTTCCFLTNGARRPTVPRGPIKIPIFPTVVCPISIACAPRVRNCSKPTRHRPHAARPGTRP
mmetsp:Transcript_21827/g.47167  ORF Transcript_21827/g.47167 Transcript_21827/m.47167 type:complete len:227 (-) Transcript_21827:153-833(-)